MSPEKVVIGNGCRKNEPTHRNKNFQAKSSTMDAQAQTIVGGIVASTIWANFILPPDDRLAGQTCLTAIPTAVAAAVCRTSALTNISSESARRAENSCADAT